MTTLNRRRITPVLLVVALGALGCADPVAVNKPAFTGDQSKAIPERAEPEGGGGEFKQPDRSQFSGAAVAAARAALGQPAGCDELLDTSCLLPFPSNAYTRLDNTTPTGRRVALPAGQLPNNSNATLDVTEWNRNDGFSPSSNILVSVPGVDLVKSRTATIDSVAWSVRADSPTLLVNAESGQLVPHWVELDSRGDGDPLMIIRPAVSLREANHFVVGLRNLKDASGADIPAPVGFQAYRDNIRLPGDDPANARLDARQEAMEHVFKVLGEQADAKADRSSLYLAWDFTVASSDSLAGRVLAMRDDALGRLGGKAPSFAVNEVTNGRNGTKVARGSFQVPSYLTNGSAPGSRMQFRADAPEIPQYTGDYSARFTCVMPADAEPATLRPVVYGHGLLGSREEVAQSDDVATTVTSLKAIYCATDWIGLSAEDQNQAAAILGNLSLLPTATDRMQQSLINTVVLGRLLHGEGGLGTDKRFQVNDSSLIDTTEVFFDGNSQGGIMGGAATAISTEWTRAVLGVTGMNYSTMLERSIDFDRFATVLENAYPGRVNQLLAYNLMQMLWDRGETSGYVQHLTARVYRGTPAKTVLLQVAFGDHQVPTVQAEIIARTLDIPYYLPETGSVLEEPRAPYTGLTFPEGVTSGWPYKLPTIRKFPHTGSALVFFDGGTPAPPAGNQPNRSGEDPHGKVRADEKAIAQKDGFFAADGALNNVCDNQPCTIGG